MVLQRYKPPATPATPQRTDQARQHHVHAFAAVAFLDVGLPRQPLGDGAQPARRESFQVRLVNADRMAGQVQPE